MIWIVVALLLGLGALVYVITTVLTDKVVPLLAQQNDLLRQLMKHLDDRKGG